MCFRIRLRTRSHYCEYHNSDIKQQINESSFKSQWKLYRCKIWWVNYDKQQEKFSITYGRRLVSRSLCVGMFSLKCLQSPSRVFSIWKFHLYEEGVDVVQLVLVNVWVDGSDADKSSSSWFPHSWHHTFQFDSVLVCTQENVEVCARLKFWCLEHQR